MNTNRRLRNMYYYKLLIYNNIKMQENQITFDSTKLKSLMLQDTDITLAKSINNSEIEFNALGMTIHSSTTIKWDNLQVKDAN